MAEERDPRVSQRYRGLGAEEPPRALDTAILSAARAAVERPHAPLVTPAGRHRWYFGLAAAAVLVLAVGVSVHVGRQAPEDPEAPSAAAPPPQPAQQAAEGPPAAGAAVKPSETPRAAKKQAVKKADASEGPKPVEEAPQVGATPAAPAEPQAIARDRALASTPQPAAAPAARSATAGLAEGPEAQLQRIAELRRQGRHDDADTALAEFHKRYPDYRIPAEMRERVERR